MDRRRRGTDARAVEKWRAEARRCTLLAEMATTPGAERLLRELARDYKARAIALEMGMPLPPSRFIVD